ncbi:uncharacterized protein TRAVEDRAFT_38527 [Trametes versicolor FP-101664 SS1]|uniref:uncharacterized protein n=1 Tax=Trametes versicolor (strain FP-101664) TaxID=717944 RepID=UPI0004622AD7|nr:uncharacterized protein TRAVEDRAFT_38527 [Trametes versicolor FP-101664 SS1]EIW56665.1 hypothetical protein TRAVEDRAFT_38527 [Trametes versicolor FP-101664 SS1]
MVHPARPQLVKPNELESALARPLNVAAYEPGRQAAYFAATLSYGIIAGHPFLDGNKRTAFFLVNEYLCAQGLSGLLDKGKDSEVSEGLVDIAEHHINVAAGKLGVEGLLGPSAPREPP